MFSEETLQDILSRNFVRDASLVVDEILLYLERSPEIEVKILLLSNSKYLAQTEWKFWGPKQGDPYHHCTWADTPEETFLKLLHGFQIYYQSDHPSDLMFWVKTNNSCDRSSYVYVDGDGNYISYQEVVERREKYISDSP